MDSQLFNTHIETFKTLVTPEEIKFKLPLTDSAEKTVLASRKEIEAILKGDDNRKFIVVGPCSIHDIKAAEEYSERLKILA